MDKKIIKALGDAFRREHQNACYPSASEGEQRIAAEAMVKALTEAGFSIVPSDR